MLYCNMRNTDLPGYFAYIFSRGDLKKTANKPRGRASRFASCATVCCLLGWHWQRVQWRTVWMKIVDELLARNRLDVRMAAKFITWAEESALIMKEDEPVVLEKTRALAP